MIEPDNPESSISRSGYYYAPVPENGATSEPMAVIDQVFMDCPWVSTALSLLTPTLARAAVPTDPQGSGVSVSAVNWMQGTSLGTVATVVAVIAVAAVGFG
ncbi:hypothetical protein OY671_007911, partial [Metschnikowia pulcherrima]